MGKFIRNWVIVFVLQFILTLLWHTVIFVSQYTTHLSGIATYVDGKPTPLIPFFILAHIIATLGSVLYIPRAANSKREYVWHGVIMGIVTFGMFAILSHALFANWTLWLMGMDLSFGILAGAITGLALAYLQPKPQM